MVRSRFHPVHFWLLNTFGVVLLLTAAIVGHVVFWRNYGHTTTGQQALMLFGSLSGIAACYAVYYIRLGYRVVSMDTEKLTVGEENFLWNDLESVNFDEIVYTGYGTGRGVQLHFRHKRSVNWIDDHYANSWQLKQFIEQYVLEHQVQPELAQGRSAGYPEWVLKGSLLSWSWTYLILSVVALALLQLANGVPFANVLTGVTVAALILSPLLFLLFYFGATDEHLIVRHPFWPGNVTAFAFRDIRRAVFEKRGKGIHTLLIETRDFRQHRYYCDWYSKADCRNFKRWIAGKITFRDETTLNPEPPSPVTHE